MVTSSADMIREMIEDMVAVVSERGGDLIHGSSERVEALWIDIAAHLREADLCEMLGNTRQLNHHLEAINGLMGTILELLPA
ncbi:MAG TPA: hypothetical protein VKT77_19420 [Chthonomonadaceae bacterium]|nr:hypothetical protein [Chthonomonadaceae bacterium]